MNRAGAIAVAAIAAVIAMGLLWQHRAIRVPPPIALVFPGSTLESAVHPRSVLENIDFSQYGTREPSRDLPAEAHADIYSYRTTAPAAACAFYRDKITAAGGKIDFCDCSPSSPTLLSGALMDTQGRYVQVTVGASGYILRVSRSQ